MGGAGETTEARDGDMKRMISWFFISLGCQTTKGTRDFVGYNWIAGRMCRNKFSLLAAQLYRFGEEAESNRSSKTSTRKTLKCTVKGGSSSDQPW